MIKKIKILSNIFIKDYFQNLYIFNKDTKKVNKKSGAVWLAIISALTIGLLSYKIIDFLGQTRQEILFLKIYLPILATVFIFQAILICTNVFYFSKDLEYILPLPIKPIELLIAKFNNVISITYGMELLLLFIPLIIYGILTVKSIFYYFMMIFVLLIFPVFLILIVSTIMLLIMQLTKFIKNKDIFQIIIVAILTFILTSTDIYMFNSIFGEKIINIESTQNIEIEDLEKSLQNLNNKIDKLNKYFIIINPCISLLTESSFNNICIQILKLLLLNAIMFILFLFFGKILYLKNLLKNIAYINKKKNKKKIIKNKYKKNKIKKSYKKMEWLKIIRNPTFFLQCIFQYIFIIIIILIIFNMIFPVIIDNFIQEDYLNKLGKNDFSLQCIFILLGVVQIIPTLGNISLTAISREGKDAIFMKYIPVPLFKQFLWKSIPQIFCNSILIMGLTFVVVINIPKISITYYIASVVLAMILNIINSFLMLIVDLKKPNLDWITETSVLKDNKNKLYQYVLTILIVLMLLYFTKVFTNINIKISVSIISIIFTGILVLIVLYIKKNINKLFKNIY